MKYARNEKLSYLGCSKCENIVKNTRTVSSQCSQMPEGIQNSS